jgi:hypothetical protein
MLVWQLLQPWLLAVLSLLWDMDDSSQSYTSLQLQSINNSFFNITHNLTMVYSLPAGVFNVVVSASVSEPADADLGLTSALFGPIRSNTSSSFGHWDSINCKI